MKNMTAIMHSMSPKFKSGKGQHTKESIAQVIPFCRGKGHQDISQSTFSVIQRRKTLMAIWYEGELENMYSDELIAKLLIVLCWLHKRYRANTVSRNLLFVSVYLLLQEGILWHETGVGSA